MPGYATVKEAALVAVAPEVVTVMVPLVAPAGTLVVRELSEPTVKVAVIPLKATLVVPVKPEPVRVTGAPTGPPAGAKLARVRGAGGVTAKAVGLEALPPGLVTVMAPLVAPAGTLAVTEVSEPTVKVAVIPLKATLVVPVKPEPVRVTGAPGVPLAGPKLVTAGVADAAVKGIGRLPVPPGLVTVIRPVVAPAGTTVRMAVSDRTEKTACTPLKETFVAELNPVPEIVTPVPTGADGGVNPFTDGAGTTLKRPVLNAVVGTEPMSVVTPTGPIWAPTGTTAETWVGETFRNDVAATPPKVTVLAPASPVPSMSTVDPTRPATGVSPVTRGLTAASAGVRATTAGGGVTGGQARTLRSPSKLKRPPTEVTKDRIRLPALVSVLTV